MTVFAVINLDNPAAIHSALSQNFAGDFLQLSPTEFLVAARGVTAKDISDRLGITTGTNGGGVVLTSAGYFGRAANNIWEWLTVKIQQP